MPVQILIPASEVKNREGNPLILENDQRCSRCNQSPAGYFEVHKLHYRIGFKHSHLYGKKYRISKNYLLKIGVCEPCYKSDFLTHPELLDQNNSHLAKISRLHSTAWTIGGLLACCGFLLLTPIIPHGVVLSKIKLMWQIPVIMGVIVLFLSWLSQKKYQTQILHEMEAVNPGFRSRARAEIHTYVLRDEDNPTETALEIHLDNIEWAEGCANRNHWKHEQTSNPENETLSKG